MSLLRKYLLDTCFCGYELEEKNVSNRSNQSNTRHLDEKKFESALQIELSNFHLAEYLTYRFLTSEAKADTDC